MTPLYLYNTLSRQKEEFRPITDRFVGLYTCGPTVYNYAHIGNLRSFLFADILVRTLRYDNYEVKWVMNITDVDDKTIRDSKVKYPDLEPMAALQKFTGEFEVAFWQDLAELNIGKPDSIPHAASDEYIAKMQELVTKIFTAGFAYVADGSVYFNLAKYLKDHQYGRLTEIDPEAMKASARVEADEYDKENLQDFVLWKGQKEGEPSWDYELDGQSLPGRPGWHIECSAMSESELGSPFDIHTGGIDLKFPHHENEICQSVIGFAHEQPVNYWLHNEFVLVDGKKMAKRENNFYALKDLKERKLTPLAYRYAALQTSYRKPLNFTWESMMAAQSGLKKLIRELANLGEEKGEIDPEWKAKFVEKINDDLNTPEALAVMQEVLKSSLSPADKLATILDMDKVLGLDLASQIKAQNAPIPEEVTRLLREREEARQGQNWAKSDALRARIESLGYTVEDTPDGQQISNKKLS